MGRKATVELVLDCAEPKRLAKFWRAALDYREHYARRDSDGACPQRRDRVTATPSGSSGTQSE